MADPTPLNSQITDAVTQVSVAVLGSAPSEALALNMLSGSHSAALSVQNALASQQHLATLALSTTAQAINQILSIDTAAMVRASELQLAVNGLAVTLAQLKASQTSSRESSRLRQRECRIPGQTVVLDDVMIENYFGR